MISRDFDEFRLTLSVSMPIPLFFLAIPPPILETGKLFRHLNDSEVDFSHLDHNDLPKYSTLLIQSYRFCVPHNESTTRLNAKSLQLLHPLAQWDKDALFLVGLQISQ